MLRAASVLNQLVIPDLIWNPANIECGSIPAARQFGVAKDAAASDVCWIPDQVWNDELLQMPVELTSQCTKRLFYKEIVGGIRVISFRKANDREVFHYDQQRS